jgi:hypothetical protein
MQIMFSIMRDLALSYESLSHLLPQPGGFLVT